MKLFKVSEVARMLNISRQSVYELIDRGRIKAYRLSERGIRIPDTELFSWLENRKVRQRKEKVVKII